MRKNVIERKPVITNGDMSGNITSDAVDLMFLDNVDLIHSWTGTSPVGELVIEVTNNDINNQNALVEWVQLNFGNTITISANDGEDLIVIRGVPGRFLRAKYLRTSGSGTLQLTLSARQL
jgi:hypothetical protein